jgi:hypothetical protein
MSERAHHRFDGREPPIVAAILADLTEIANLPMRGSESIGT